MKNANQNHFLCSASNFLINDITSTTITLIDKNKGTTSHGVSVSHRENVVYKIDINSRQLHTYLDCNKIERIAFLNSGDETPPDIRTTCSDCKGATISLVNSQISELLRLQLNEHIIDGLYWHLSQLVSSQHFSGPIPLKSDFNWIRTRIAVNNENIPMRCRCDILRW